jgi:tripartite-type tricarboxylate transporter receptor subunit TctC
MSIRFLSFVISTIGFFSLDPSFGQGLTSNQNFPNKAIALIVPYTSGTTADILARTIGAQLSLKLKTTTVVDNRAGASGIIGTDFVAKSQPNGYTLLFTATSHGTIPALKDKLPYDPLNSFTPVILLAKSTMGLAINPNLPISSIKEFIDYSRAHPKQSYYSSPGAGGIQHLAMELLAQELNITLTHVPYKGAAGAITDLIAGQVQSSIVSMQTSSNFINSGQIKMLAVLSEDRSNAYPNIPTFKESGFNALIVDTWYGVLAPANLPVEVLNKLNLEINEILIQADNQEKLNKLGLDVVGGKPEILKKLISSELAKWKRVVKAGKIEIN